jgi:hypothetical protein
VTPGDGDVTFYVETWRNTPLLLLTLGHLRVAYPGERVVVFSDGDLEARGEPFLDLGAEFLHGERLWPAGGSGLLWKRRLDHFFRSPTPWLVKVDSDTAIYRSVRDWPAGPCLFGTINHHPDGPQDFVQGGWIGMDRASAGKILSSGLLNSDLVRDMNHDAALPVRISSDDRAISAVAERLGIPLIDHPEIACFWRRRTPNPDLRYAVVHPAKDGLL